MYPRLLSGECFYDHACLLMHEKDVLELEMSGAGRLMRMRRWWQDLFLLSYGDKRAQVYYASTHAMRMERAKQFYINKSSIHPLSKFRQFWDYAIVPIVILNTLIFYHSSSMTYGEGKWQLYALGALLEGALFADLCLGLRTGYVHAASKRVVLNRRRVLLHYASSELFVHVLASFPVQCVMLMRYGRLVSCAICKANCFVVALEVLGAFRVYRLIAATSRWGAHGRRVRLSCWLKLLRVAILGFIVMHVSMRMADAIAVATIISRGRLSCRSYYASVLSMRYGSAAPPANHVFYCLEFARICKSFLLFSFSLTCPAYFPDKMTSLFAYLVAMTFYMWSLVECYFFVCYLNYPHEQMCICVDRAMTLARWRSLPDAFSEKLLSYFRFNMTRLTVTEKQNGLHRSLPTHLKREVAGSCYRRLLLRVACFAAWPRHLIDRMVALVDEEIYLAGDVVAESSVPSEGLTIIIVGVLAVYSAHNEEAGHLTEGDYVSELCLVTDREVRLSSLVALTPCKVLFLEKRTFRDLMKSHPELFHKLKDRLTEEYASHGRYPPTA